MALHLKAFQEALLKIIPVQIESPKFLLAVSGGLDSMVLVDLFSQSNWPFGIAHCNFQLRGAAADQDAAFVKNKAEALGVGFYLKTFDTKSFASEQKLSIQDAARQLRYQWLEEIRSQHQFDFILTAHHLDDSLETFLFNFSKGSGLKGLLGIPAQNGVILRPLLGFSRAEIEIYYQRRQLRHREDASNATDDYDRNKIRHQIIPALQKINPQLLQSVAGNLQHLNDSYLLFQAQVEQLQKQMVSQQSDQVLIDTAQLLKHPARATLLFEWLRPKGFHPNQIPQLMDCIVRKKTGALFYSQSHRLLVNRAQLIIQGINLLENHSHQLTRKPQSRWLAEGKLTLEEVPKPEQFPNDPSIAYLAIEKLSFPLTLRRWQAGDQFCPFGMKGQHKKVQDLLSDLKINRFEKEHIWVLENGNQEICWVVGLRMDERFKLSVKSKRCLRLEFQKTRLDKTNQC